MPAEFLVSSWHLLRARSETVGTVITSQEQRHRGATRSKVVYSYVVNGTEHDGNRVRPGFTDNNAYEVGGGDFARSLKVGQQIPVFFDPAQPKFSLLLYGWPKWSVGFSLGVWGLIFGAWAFSEGEKRPTSRLFYAFTRAMTVSGFLCVMFFPPTLARQELLWLLGLFLSLILFAYCHARIRFKPEPVIGKYGLVRM